MLIHIEYCKGDKLLFGKRKLTRAALTSITEQIFAVTDEDGFVSVFCEKLGFVEIPYHKHAKADFLIDLDTRCVFISFSKFPHELHGARVLYYTEKGNFGEMLGQEKGEHKIVFYLAICADFNDNTLYICDCDENFEVLADGCLDTVEHGLQVGRDINPNVVWHELTEDNA